MEMETTNHERTHAENWRGVRMMSSRTIRIVLGSAILFSMGFAIGGIGRAQQIPEALYSEMKWRMIGPFRGGKVNAVAGVPGNPTLCWWRRWATALGRTRSAAFSVHRMAEEAGRKFCTKTISRARWTCVSSQGIRAWFTRHCGTGFESQGRRELRLVPAAGSTNQRMKA